MSSSASVTIYTTPSCIYCHMVKEYLKGKKVSYQDIDIWEDQNAGMKLMEKTGMAAVPVTEIGDEVIIGFDRDKIDGALRENGLI